MCRRLLFSFNVEERISKQRDSLFLQLVAQVEMDRQGLQFEAKKIACDPRRLASDFNQRKAGLVFVFVEEKILL
jgi:hypothetical protein